MKRIFPMLPDPNGWMWARIPMGPPGPQLRSDPKLMDRVPGDRTDIRVPSEDDSIAEALAELDGKLAAWGAAMRTAEASFTEMSAGSLYRTGTVDPSEEDEPAPSGADGEPRGVAAAPGTDSGDGDTESKRSEAGPALVAVQAGAETAGDVKETQGSAMAATVQPVAAEAESETASDPDRDKGEDEDEALLDTLDPKTAEAIRVMRRLTPARKSVRELLREYEANKASEPAAQPQKKSWFLRKR